MSSSLSKSLRFLVKVDRGRRGDWGRGALGPVRHEGWKDILIIVIGFNGSRSVVETGRRSRRGLDNQKFGLYVIEVGKAALASNWGVTKVAIGGRVDLYDKGRKEDMHAKTVHANETTTPLALMSLKTVQRVTEVWDMEAIPDEDRLAIEGDDSCTVTKDGGKRIVTHPNTPAQNRMVGNERRLIREHVVGGSGVSNK